MNEIRKMDDETCTVQASHLHSATANGEPRKRTQCARLVLADFFIRIVLLSRVGCLCRIRVNCARRIVCVVVVVVVDVAVCRLSNERRGRR